MQPFVSIIVISYNTRDLTKKCLESVWKHDSISKEIIVVDNASTDLSVEFLEKLRAQQKIILIKNNENKGFSYACNQAIRKAKGRHILLLNSDTLITKNAITNLVSFADENPEAGVVGSRLLNPDGSIQPSCLNFPTVKNAFLEYFLGMKNSFGKYAPMGKTPVVVDTVVGASFLITSGALKKVGLMNEKYFFYYEDHDYCMRVKSAGLRVYYLPTSIVYHYHGESGKKVADISNQWRRLVPSSKIYHGVLEHHVLTFILWSGQKWQKIFSKRTSR